MLNLHRSVKIWALGINAILKTISSFYGNNSGHGQKVKLIGVKIVKSM